MQNAAQPVDTGLPLVQLPAGKRNAVLGAVLLGLFLSALDQTVVGTALPRIVTDLSGNGYYTWVVTSYLLTSTVTVPIYGKFSDVYGRKVMLLIGIALFLAGSWLSGLSQNMTQLIVFRGLQGLGAGALFPISLAIIGDIFTPRERGRYQGFFGAVFGLSFLVGPFIGGWITDNISWRWVFYVNMPVGLIALAVIAAVLPNFHPPVRTSIRSLDYVGIVVFTAAVVPILLGLTNKGLTNSHGQLYAWTDLNVGGLILLGAVLIAVFIAVEARAAQPIIPLGLFRNRSFTVTNVAVFMISLGMFSAIIFLPRYYQAIRGISATQSGYMVWPLLVGLMGTSIGAGMLVSKVGRYKWLMVGAMVFFVLGSFLMTHIQTSTSDPMLWLWMFIMGIGIGPTMSVSTVVIQSSAQPAQLGVATSTMTFLRQMGGTIGLAIAGEFFSEQFAKKLPVELAANGVPPAVIKKFSAHGSATGQLTGVGLRAQLAHVLPAPLHSLIPHIVAGVYDAFALAIGQVFWLTVGAGVAAFLAMLVLPDLPLRGRVHGAATAADVIPGAEAPAAPAEGAALR
ncbi:MAG TPA: MDR family MFS transporter [Chloroflexota bacterium]|nr:MDR family MFS transporter [Chloroflexota bacterium]